MSFLYKRKDEIIPGDSKTDSVDEDRCSLLDFGKNYYCFMYHKIGDFHEMLPEKLEKLRKVIKETCEEQGYTVTKTKFSKHWEKNFCKVKRSRKTCMAIKWTI